MGQRSVTQVLADSMNSMVVSETVADFLHTTSAKPRRPDPSRWLEPRQLDNLLHGELPWIRAPISDGD